MKKYQGIVVAVFIGLVAMVCTSCPELMSTSWGRWAKRSPEIPTITDDNLDDLLDATVGDPDFAKALLKELKKQIRNKGPEKRAKFQGAAITTAANGSGLDTLVLTNVGKLIEAADDENVDKITETFDDIFDDADHGTIHSLAGDLTEILLSGDTYDSTNYWNNPSVTTDSLLVATVLLLIDETDNQGADRFDQYLEDFKEKRESSDPLTDNEEAILILVKQLVKQDSDTFGTLLEGLELDDIK
jgi:hypothetical protein